MRILELGFDAFLDQCVNPEVQRIVMLDGPTVLGWDTWHELDERYAFGTHQDGADRGRASSGRVEEAAVDPLSHLLLGAIMQAGMVVARADDPVAAKQAMAETFAADRLVALSQPDAATCRRGPAIASAELLPDPRRQPRRPARGRRHTRARSPPSPVPRHPPTSR